MSLLDVALGPSIQLRRCPHELPWDHCWGSTPPPSLADRLIKAATDLAKAEEDVAVEYLRLVTSGMPTWQAQKQAEVAFGALVHVRRAEYEIALVRLQHGSTAP